MMNDKGTIEYATKVSTESFFQARYAIRYPWTGPMKCKKPQRNIWGGPPNGNMPQLIAATGTAYAPRGRLQLANVIRRDLWEIGFKRAITPPKPTTPAPGAQPPKPAGPVKTQLLGGAAIVLLAGLGLARRRRRH
jgi:MYXO-CTERM domain-containing protein